MKYILVILMLAVVLLTGCMSIEEQNEALKSQFVGKQFETFILVYGEPYDDYQLKSGNTMYSWTSGEKVYTTPEQTSIEYDDMTETTTVTTDPSREYIQVCNMRIVVDPQGIIKDISILQGSNSCQVSAPKD